MNVLHVIDESGTWGDKSVFIALVDNSNKYYNHVVVIGGDGWLNDQIVKAGFHPKILDAIAKVIKHNEKIKVFIAGEGRPDRVFEFNNQIKKLELDKIIFYSVYVVTSLICFQVLFYLFCFLFL